MFRRPSDARADGELLARRAGGRRLSAAEPPGARLAVFDGRLRNVGAQPRTFQVTVVAPFQPATSASVTLALRNFRMINFKQAVLSGVEPPTPAAPDLRVTCQ